MSYRTISTTALRVIIIDSGIVQPNHHQPDKSEERVARPNGNGRVLWALGENGCRAAACAVTCLDDYRGKRLDGYLRVRIIGIYLWAAVWAGHRGRRPDRRQIGGPVKQLIRTTAEKTGLNGALK